MVWLVLQGFLAKDLQAEALGKLDHKVKVAAEQFMKILEQIDSLVRPHHPVLKSPQFGPRVKMSNNVIKDRHIFFSSTELARKL